VRFEARMCCDWWRSETAYSLLQGRPEPLLPEGQAQEGQICAPGSRITLLHLSQLGTGKINSFAKSHPAREAGKISPAPGCHSL